LTFGYLAGRFRFSAGLNQPPLKWKKCRGIYSSAKPRVMPRHDIAKILYEEAIGIMENTIEM